MHDLSAKGQAFGCLWFKEEEANESMCNARSFH